MNVATLNDARQRENAQRLAVIDCDIHPAPRSPADFLPYLTQRWQDHMKTFGAHVRQGLTGQEVHPRMMARGMRADAFPEDGPAGSDLELMRRQHLDLNGVEYAMMIPLGASVIEERNPHYAAALSHAANEWQIATWIENDHRLKGAVIIPQEDVETSVQRDRQARPRQPLSADHHVAEAGRAAWVASGTGRSTRRRAVQASRSRFIRCSPAAVIHRAASAGRPTTSRITTRSAG